MTPEEKIRENYEKWKDSHDVKDQMRLNDDSFHNHLVFHKETGEFSILTESGNTNTEGVVYVHEFTNGQDVANMDSTEYEGFFLSKENLVDAEISEEKIEKILDGKIEIGFDDFGCEEDFRRFLRNLVQKNIITEEESDEIYDCCEKRVLEKFLAEEELEEMNQHFEESMLDFPEEQK